MADKDSWWKDTAVNKKSDTVKQSDKANSLLTTRTVQNNQEKPSKNKVFETRHVHYKELPPKYDNVKNSKKDNK
ncbi:hypothetical protein [Bacillus altitudinis]|uniref:hypothetical protein n=1 Tax=Bacillus altitudinis TaxID=293387 RepID=UPI0034E4240E